MGFGIDVGEFYVFVRVMVDVVVVVYEDYFDIGDIDYGYVVMFGIVW